MKSMGWKGTSKATFNSRIWGQSRPVVHAAAAYLLWERDLVDEFHLPANTDRFLACLASAEILKQVILASEIARLELPLIRRFRIKEEDTIQFLA
jgi:hypothetical protein